MRKLFRQHLPDHNTVLGNRWLRPLAGWLSSPNLWHINRRSVAGGVAVGLFCGLIPGPVQMMGGALLSVLFRVNLPVALLTTLYTNPFTIVPLYALAYQYGAWVIGQGEGGRALSMTLPELHWHDWYHVWPDWLASMGKPLFVGLPLLAATLALLGYAVVRIVWWWRVLHLRDQRKQRR